MPIIYHVTTAEEWNAAKKKASLSDGEGLFASSSLAIEGFIHCSQDHQVAGVLQKYFDQKTGLIKLVIDTEKLTSRFVFEWSPSAQDTFPHIYGPINMDAVTDIVALL